MENAVVRREATMTRMVNIVRLMARDIIHSNKSEKPKVRAIELPYWQPGGGMHDKYQYSRIEK